MRYLYMEQIIIFYCQYRAASQGKQAVLIYAGHAAPRRVLSSWDIFFGDFKI